MDEIAVASSVWFTAVKERSVGTPPRMVGPTILAHVKGAKREALRFDPFPVGPHYHYFAPDDETPLGKQFPIDPVLVGDQVEHVLETILPKLPAMLRHAGYTLEADAIAEAPLAEAIDNVRASLGRAVVPA